MTKLEDVAKKAGVSATTVSRVINKKGYLSKETVGKVQAAMRNLNYLPNVAARSMQGKGTSLIGVIFPTVSHPFFGEMVAHIERILFGKGYKVILCNSESDKEKEQEHLRMLGANRVDGIITGTHNADIKEYEATGAPIIAFDRNLSKNVPIVSSDNFLGGKIATEALLAAGAKKIAILTKNNHPSLPTYQRYEGYAQTVTAHGQKPLQLQCVQPTDTLKAMQIAAILKSGQADGFVCTDDLTAIMVINEAKKLSLRVPQDIKVVGYDASTLIRNYYPFLTTVAQPIEDCAILMCDLLLRRIVSPKEEMERQYILPVKLLTGGSVLKDKRQWLVISG
jgi:LacI family sucrose operon transcriptional repressor